jgi:hypothetical protein
MQAITVSAMPKLPSHAISFAANRMGELDLLSWSCVCGERSEWRAADVSRKEADGHLRRMSPEAMAFDFVADGVDTGHRDAMTDELLRRFNILKRDLLHAALARAGARRETARRLLLIAASEERIALIPDGEERVRFEAEREKHELELAATRARHEEDECGRRVDVAADALLAEIERGRRG